MRTIGRVTSSLLLLPLSVLLLGACGDDDSPTEPGGDEASFEITLSGDVSKTFTGQAVFESDVTSEGVEGFGVVSATSSSGDLQTFVLAREGDRPSSGQYTIADPEQGGIPSGQFGVGITFEDSDGNQVTLGSTGGTVNIDQSNSSQVSGTFTATMFGASITNGTQVDSVDVTANGTFNAVSATEFSPSGG